MNVAAKTMLGLGTGAAAMYFFDPALGRRRRAGVRDMGVRLWHRTSRFSDKAATDFANRARGLGAAATSAFAQTETNDSILVDRVRAMLGRLTSHPGAIDVTAENGTVTLRGAVLSGDVKRILSGVNSIKGVREVVNRLEEHETAENVPALQGGRPVENRSELMQTCWTPALRATAGVAGGALFAYGIQRGGTSGTLVALAGSGMLLRSVVNRDLRTIAGFGDERAIEIHKAVTINASIDKVFDLWSNPQNFPRFMSHVTEVSDRGQARSHWKITLPGGVPLEWDAELTRYEKNSELAWRTVPGAAIEHSGSATFRSTPNGSTQVNLRIAYDPPAGVIGHAVASALGADPKALLEDDLVRLKSLLEQGKATGREHQVRLEDMQLTPAT